MQSQKSRRELKHQRHQHESQIVADPRGPEENDAQRHRERRGGQHQPEVLRMMLIAGIQFRMRDQQPQPRHRQADGRKPGENTNFRHR
ncbi:hypothetical protein [Nocardia seriolae]|uniref:hypothetical protein n=1 Tax=Nocardia seriolae TaxID=37332 RepID=UPI0009E09390